MTTEQTVEWQAHLDLVNRWAVRLNAAWHKYTTGFGEPPHGTLKQLAALLEFAHLDEDPQIAADHQKALAFDAMMQHRLVLYLRDEGDGWGCEDDDGFERGRGPTPVHAVKDALAKLK